MHILNIIVFLFLKTVFSYSMQNTNTLDAMAKAGHDNKEGHPSSPSQLLSQLAGKKTGDTKVYGPGIKTFMLFQKTRFPRKYDTHV